MSEAKAHSQNRICGFQALSLQTGQGHRGNMSSVEEEARVTKETSDVHCSLLNPRVFLKPPEH